MFDANLCRADDLQEIAGLCRKLIANQVAELRRLGHARDIELLFADGYCRPDWSLADGLGVDAGRIVREIFDLSHDIARAGDELELREWPN
jgi:hypothetical protein